jgi:Uma2 family endonuclease
MSTPLKPAVHPTGAGRAVAPVGRNGWSDPLGDTIPNDWPVAPDGLPTLFEDEGQEDMRETRQHNDSTDILFYGAQAHLADRPEFDVFCNLNLYYRPEPDESYVSPDVMVTRPPQPLPRDLRWYRLGEHGPAPVLSAEVLSRRSFQQQDLSNKIVLYHRLGVAEYLLIDATGELLPERLLLKRRTKRGWQDTRDVGDGVTSDLGFRVVIEADDRLRVFHAATGRPYPRPDEALTEAEARRRAEDRIRELEAQIARLKAARTPRRGKKK